MAKETKDKAKSKAKPAKDDVRPLSRHKTPSGTPKAKSAKAKDDSDVEGHIGKRLAARSPRPRTTATSRATSASAPPARSPRPRTTATSRATSASSPRGKNPKAKDDSDVEGHIGKRSAARTPRPRTTATSRATSASAPRQEPQGQGRQRRRGPHRQAAHRGKNPKAKDDSDVEGHIGKRVSRQEPQGQGRQRRLEGHVFRKNSSNSRTHGGVPRGRT